VTEDSERREITKLPQQAHTTSCSVQSSTKSLGYGSFSALHRHLTLALANAFSLDTVDLSEADLIPSRRPQYPACTLPPVDDETPPSAFRRLFNSARTALMASSNAAAAQVTRQTFPGVKHGEQPGLEDVAGLIKAGKAKRVIVMVSERIGNAG
jgi:hypothetical protein